MKKLVMAVVNMDRMTRGMMTEIRVASATIRFGMYEASRGPVAGHRAPSCTDGRGAML